MWELYGPQALQYTHAILYGADAWTVAPARSTRAQTAALKAGLTQPDSLLAL